MSISRIWFYGFTRPADEVDSACHRDALALWTLGSARSALVSRELVAIDHEPRALCSTAVLSVADSPRRYQFRMLGAEIANVVGDLVGRWTDSLDFGGHLPVMEALCGEAVDTRRPLLHTIGATFEGKTCCYSHLTLPLSNGAKGIDELWLITHSFGCFADTICDWLGTPSSPALGMR